MNATVKQGLANCRRALLVYLRKWNKLKRKYNHSHSLTWDFMDQVYVNTANYRLYGMAKVLGLSRNEELRIKREVTEQLDNKQSVLPLCSPRHSSFLGWRVLLFQKKN
ncbi:hypothetical protein HY771_00635 [Candidatus Uhrbacteria bacterium]|nr:hypothetical protein [Candidatus Uhrbacteria bacterium]